MILFEDTKVFNFESAFRGMRNPMDSWNKSDSFKCPQNCLRRGFDCANCNPMDIGLGKKDIELAQNLIKAGSEHRKFMRQIFISVDIVAPRFWWTEYDTYKVGTVANSCSTMHKLKDYSFTLDMFCIEHNLDEIDKQHWINTINYLETLRKEYCDKKNIKTFRKLKEALPEGFLQKRTCTFNYENIYTMCNQRKNHRLTEWNTDFYNWAISLPYANELIFIK